MNATSIRRAGAGLLALALGWAPAQASAADEPKPQPPQQNVITPQRARELIKEYETLRAQEQDLTRFTQDLNSKMYWTLAHEGAMGVIVTKADDTLRSQLNLPADAGLVVTGLAADSPAAKAGVQAKDILMHLSGKPVGTPEDLDKLYKGLAGSDMIELELIRAGKSMSLKVESNKARLEALRAAGEQATVRAIELKRAEPPEYRIGIALSAADDTLRTHLGLPDGQGLVIEQVMAKSPAERSGLQVNDVLLKVEDDDVTKIEQVVTKIRGSEGKPLSLRLLRHRIPMTLSVTPEKSVINEGEPRETRIETPGEGNKPEFRLEFVRPGVMFGGAGAGSPPRRNGQAPNMMTEVLTAPQHDLRRIEMKLEEVMKEVRALRNDQELEALRKEVRSLRELKEKQDSSSNKKD